jgi:hypothetical protein
MKTGVSFRIQFIEPKVPKELHLKLIIKTSILFYEKTMKSEKIYTKSSYSKPIFLYFLENIMITIILHIVDFFDSLEHRSQFRMRRRNENQRHSDYRGTVIM